LNPANTYPFAGFSLFLLTSLKKHAVFIASGYFFDNSVSFEHKSMESDPIDLCRRFLEKTDLFLG